MNSMIYMALRLNISVLYRDFEKLYHDQYDEHVFRFNIIVLNRDSDQLYYKQYDEHGTKIEHQCFT